jgi:hypothetical protein
MVPVPADYETDVTRFVMQLMIAEALQAWTEDEVRDLCGRLDGHPLAVLVAIAEIVGEGRTADDRQVAERLAITTEAVVVGAVAVAETCEAMAKASILMMDNGPDSVPAHSTEVLRTFTLSPRFARTVLHAAGPSPVAAED